MIESSKKINAANMTKFEKNKTTFILCDCRSEILFIEYDEETKSADFAIYEHFFSYSQKMSFWQKIRYIYQVIMHNKPYSDQIILNKHQLKDLKMFINGCI